MADPQFVLVMSVSPHNNGNFGRAGLRFTRDWRPLEVAEKADLEKSVIDREILARLKAESFLAVKPATAEEIARLAEARADSAKDKDSELAELRERTAQYEARLMRLEVSGARSADADEVELLRQRNAELEQRLAAAAIEAKRKDAEFEQRLARLEGIKEAAATERAERAATAATAAAAVDPRNTSKK